MKVEVQTSDREVLAGLVERVTYHMIGSIGGLLPSSRSPREYHDTSLRSAG